MKKSQISIFVIIGAILLIVTAFLFFNSKYEIFVTYDTKLKNQVSDIVKTCIENDATTGAFLLGFQGGYINIPKNKIINPEEHTDFGLKIPNWDSENNDIPTIESMQKELNNYIKEESYSCIKTNLKSLEEFLEINIDQEMQIETQINNENIIIQSDLPITFNEKNSNEILSISKNIIKLEGVRLGDLYSLATQIYNLEIGTNLFEELTLDQIYSASDYTSPLSMPSEGMDFTCNKRIWTYPQLKRNLANLNNNNFKYLFFKGTYPISEIYDANLNKEYGTYDNRAYFENNYVYQLSNPKKSFENYQVNVVMPSTEITGNEGYLQRYPFRTFEVTPNSGNIVKPISMEMDLGAKIPIPCIQIYHHLYELDYDLIIKLTDRNEDGQNYFFQFPLRILIKNNNAKIEPQTPIISKQETTATNENFCSNESKKYPLIIYAKDKTNDMFLSNVNISYKCISLKCDLGETKKPTFKGIERIYADPYFEGDFPFCIGGKVIAEKEGYHQGKIRIDTTKEILNSQNPIYYDIDLIPTKEFKVDKGTFLIINKEDGSGHRIYSQEDGNIFINIENKELEFSSDAIWPTQEGFLDTITLLDDENIRYNVSVIYTDSKYNLKGILELENWKPEIHNGNNIEIIVPGTTSPIDEDKYLEFYEYMQKEILNPFTYIGIRII